MKSTPSTVITRMAKVGFVHGILACPEEMTCTKIGNLS